MIGQAQVVVNAPNENFLPSESHLVGDVSFQLGKSEVAMALTGMLSDGAPVLTNAVENIQDKKIFEGANIGRLTFAPYEV